MLTEMNLMYLVLGGFVALGILSCCVQPRFRKSHPVHGQFVDDEGHIEFSVPYNGHKVDAQGTIQFTVVPKDETALRFMQFCFVKHRNHISVFNRYKGRHELCNAERLFLTSEYVRVSRYSDMMSLETVVTKDVINDVCRLVEGNGVVEFPDRHVLITGLKSL